MLGVIPEFTVQIGNLIGKTAVYLIARRVIQKSVVMQTVLHTVENKAPAKVAKPVYLGQTSPRVTNGILTNIPIVDWCPTIVAIQMDGVMRGVLPRLRGLKSLNGKIVPCLFA